MIRSKNRMWKQLRFALCGLSGIVVLSLLITSSIVFASDTTKNTYSLFQEGSTATPNTPTGNEVQATMEPFLQTDLRIISGNVQRPNGIYWYDGFLYTNCAGDYTIYRIQDTTGVTSTYIAGVQNAHTLIVEPGPILWVPDFQRNALVRIDTSQSPARLDLSDDLASPWGLGVMTDGSFLVTQLRTDDVVHITRAGVVSVVARDFRNPTGIVVDDSVVYIANNGSARRAIEWFAVDPENPAAPIEADAIQPLVSGLQNTTNLVLGPDNLLYFAYSLGTRGIVGRVDPQRCRDQGGCTNVDIEIVLWSELAAPLAGLSISDDLRLFVHTMFGSEIYWVQLPGDIEAISNTE